MNGLFSGRRLDSLWFARIERCLKEGSTPFGGCRTRPHKFAALAFTSYFLSVRHNRDAPVNKLVAVYRGSEYAAVLATARGRERKPHGRIQPIATYCEPPQTKANLTELFTTKSSSSHTKRDKTGPGCALIQLFATRRCFL